MEKDKKTFIAFILANLTPTIAWIVFVPIAFLVMVLLNPIGLGPENLNLLTKIFRFLILGVMVYVYIIVFAIFVFAFSAMHMLFLAIPTFLMAHRLKIIRWYTVLPASFFIGAAPYPLFMWGTPKDVVFVVTMTMGIFGFSAGIAFWLLWRYWVSPENYIKKANSIAPFTP